MIANKLSPSAGLIYDYLMSKEVDGERVDKYGKPFEIDEKLKERLYPIFWGTIKELYEEQPATVATFLSGLAFIGMGASNYDTSKTNPKDRYSKEASPLVEKAYEKVPVLPDYNVDKGDYEGLVKKADDLLSSAVSDLNKTGKFVELEPRQFEQIPLSEREEFYKKAEKELRKEGGSASDEDIKKKAEQLSNEDYKNKQYKRVITRYKSAIDKYVLYEYYKSKGKRIPYGYEDSDKIYQELINYARE